LNDFTFIRAITVGEYIVKTGSTVRAAAAKFKYSKSTVYEDVTKRLKEADSLLYNKVKLVLAYNKSVRALHGGESTRSKYLL
jgi:putative DeoR family transcriptional regulator (stage III sporulation protein D)